ncbi:MAG: hypothetical protein QNK05_03910 [Myxococcota bacterium]|nr:hypothetical protein [Myxococcota bacterium]
MLDSLVLASRALFALAGFGAGIHLARTAIQEGGLPTHAWGSAIIFVGGLGLVGYAAAPLLQTTSPALAIAGLALSDGLERVALIGLGAFLWKVFGPASKARRLAAGTVAVVIVLDWIAVLRFQAWPETALPMPLAATTHLAFGVPLLWSTLESAMQMRRSRRQLVLGLTKPIVTHRFWLWTLGSAGLFLICLVTAIEQAIDSAAGRPLLAVVRIVLHAGTAAVVALAFFPPQAYLRFVERGARHPSATA